LLSLQLPNTNTHFLITWRFQGICFCLFTV